METLTPAPSSAPRARARPAWRVVMNAINDALAPFEAHVLTQPFTPEKIFRVLGKI